MKLELKHLAPYLPYRVKLNLTRRLFERTNVDIRNCDFRHNYTTNELYLWHNEVTYGWHEIKPILRPLSDYTDITSKAMSDLDCDLTDQMDIQEFALKKMSLSSLLYSSFDVLTRNHVDIFGLIPEGLAIDINTLK